MYGKIPDQIEEREGREKERERMRKRERERKEEASSSGKSVNRRNLGKMIYIE